MIRTNGQFSSLNKKKHKEILQQNGFQKPSTEQINNAGDGPSGDSGQVSWNEGRRVIEVGFLAEALICQYCQEHLHLKDIKNEKRFGLASIFDVRCRACYKLCSVATGKRHSIDSSGAARCFDVNTKLAAAMVNAGVGETQITNIFATLNIPSPHHSTLKKREREIGETFEKVAAQSCKNAVFEEISATNRNGNADATVLLDGGWQKRGSGQNHNSLSGVDANIIQLAALEPKSGRTFGSYVFPPSGFIPKAVTKLTNIEIHASKMFYNSEYVPSTATKTALTNFTIF